MKICLNKRGKTVVNHVKMLKTLDKLMSFPYTYKCYKCFASKQKYQNYEKQQKQMR